MNSDSLSRWLSILANLGVLAGIFFLAMEINQNSEFLESEARNSRAQNRIDGNYQIISSPVLLTAITNIQGEKELSPEEAMAIQRFAITNLVSWQLAFEDYSAGLLELSDLPVAGWNNYMQAKYMQEQWYGWGQMNLRPDFILWFETNVIRN